MKFTTRFIFSLCFFVFASSASAEPLIQTIAKQAYIIDYDTGAVLLDKNAEEHMPTSSMSKVMTMYLVFEALKSGDISPETTFTVSERAWRMEGSKMFVEVGKQIPVADLIQGVIVQSGNDATVVLAEGLAGTEDDFAKRLTAKAHELGMNDSNFMNASGWPDPNHYSTAHDLATLAMTTIHNFPEYYPYYAEKEFTYNNIKQPNRNPLLYRGIGADGVKTGHTDAGGYGVIGSGVMDGRRVVMVVNGLADDKERAAEASKLLEWGLRQFENHKLLTAGETVATAPVYMGQRSEMPLTVDKDIMATIPKVAMNDFTVTANFKAPLVAPIEKGQQVGTLVIDVPHIGKQEHPLFAAESMPKMGMILAAVERAKMFIAPHRAALKQATTPTTTQ